MDRMHLFVRDEVLPSYFENVWEAALSVLASNFAVTQLDATHLRVPASAGVGAAVISIQGRPRYVEANVDRAHPGGAAGAYDVFVTAADQNVVIVPAPYTDNTNYAFDLAIVAAGATPPIVAGVVDVYRRVASCQWDGAQITQLDPVVNVTVAGIPSAGPVGQAALRKLGVGATDATAGNDPRVPTQPENDALQGTSGAPANGNRFVTDADPRNANARTPTGAAGGDTGGTFPTPLVVQATVSDARGSNTDPNDYAAKQKARLKTAADVGLAGVNGEVAANFVSIFGRRSAVDDSQGSAIEWAFSQSTGYVYRRSGTHAGGWGAWKLVDEAAAAYADFAGIGGSGAISGATAAGTYAVVESPGGAAIPQIATTPSVVTPSFLDPADLPSPGRTLKYRLRATLGTNATAPAANFTLGLYPITGVAAGVLTVGAVVAGSQVAINAPAANSLSAAAVEFNAPAAGYYVIGVVTSAATAAGSTLGIRARLQRRLV